MEQQNKNEIEPKREIMHGIATNEPKSINHIDFDFKNMPDRKKGMLQKMGIRFTIVFEEFITKEGAPLSFKLSYAICSPKDNFNKKIGRKIAQQRLNSKQYATIISVPNRVKNFKDYISKNEEIIEWILDKINQIKENGNKSYIDIFYQK